MGAKVALYMAKISFQKHSFLLTIFYSFLKKLKAECDDVIQVFLMYIEPDSISYQNNLQVVDDRDNMDFPSHLLYPHEHLSVHKTKLLLKDDLIVIPYIYLILRFMINRCYTLKDNNL
mgnify:CR=1 FL=1